MNRMAIGWLAACASLALAACGGVTEPGGSASGDAGGPGDGGGPPSCAPGGPGMTNCGPGGSSTESCCTSLKVPGGTYFREYLDDAGDGPSNGMPYIDQQYVNEQAGPTTVAAFRLDKYDVTVGRFRQFVLAWKGGWLPAAGSGKHTYMNGGRGLANAASPGTYETGWDPSDDANIEPTPSNLRCAPEDVGTTWTDQPGANENRPINCVSWYEAYAFCIWDGGFLPSEAEWGLAASGGDEERRYPWGSTDPDFKNHYAIYWCSYPEGDDCGVGDPRSIAPVGTPALGAGRWGQLDLEGNVRQWLLDWYGPYVTPCSNCAYLDPCPDCVVGDTIPYRTHRGGDFDSPVWALMPPLRDATPPADRSDKFGFRCARTP